MITKTALVGLAHFLMQVDPQTAQNIANQLTVDQSQQVMQLIEKNEADLPACFEQKLNADPKSKGNVLSSPSHETSSDL